MKEILLYQQAGSTNHGCEALVTTISEEIKRVTEGAVVDLCSIRAYTEKYDSVDRVVQSKGCLRSGKGKKYHPKFLFYQLDKRLFNIRFLQDIFLPDRSCTKLTKSLSCGIAIGGDNYCYGKGRINWPTDRALKKKNCKMMLWGVSVEPKDIPGELAEHLKVFDLITARESITYQALRENGLEDRRSSLCQRTGRKGRWWE